MSFFRTIGIFSSIMKAIFKDPYNFANVVHSQMQELTEVATKTDKSVLFYSIGVALSAWAKMEEGLVLIVCLLLRVNKQQGGIVMYSIVNFGTWLSIIDDLFSIDARISDLKPQWNKISADLRSIKDDRDRLAHNSVSDYASEGEIRKAALLPSRLDARKKQSKHPPLRLEEISRFAARVEVISDRIISLSEAMIERYEASPEKSQQLIGGPPQAGAQ